MPRRHSQDIFVTVALLSGASVTLPCRKHHKVCSLLERARKALGVELLTHHFLVFNDIILRPGQTLRSVHVREGNVMQLVVESWNAILPHISIRLRA